MSCVISVWTLSSIAPGAKAQINSSYPFSCFVLIVLKILTFCLMCSKDYDSTNFIVLSSGNDKANAIILWSYPSLVACLEVHFNEPFDSRILLG